MTFGLDLVDSMSVNLWAYFLVLLRSAGMVALLPAFGEQTIPQRVKLVIAMMFALAVWPALPQPILPQNLPELASAILIETAIGLILGLFLRLFILLLQVAGTIAAQSTSLSQIMGNSVADPSPAIGYLLIISAMALAMILGFHTKVAAYLINSYTMIPAGRLPEASVFAEFGTQRIARAFALAFLLAGPFVIASTIYNLTLGAINRAMPQLMVAFVGAPVITFGGMLILFLSAPTLLAVWHNALVDFMIAPSGTTP